LYQRLFEATLDKAFAVKSNDGDGDQLAQLGSTRLK
jgi:hypothetical protein